MQFGKTNLYILKYRTPVKCNLFTFTDSLAFKFRDRVRSTKINPDFFITTVFLGLDHNFSGRSSKPILFETMITKNGQWLSYQTRCCTWRGALTMHWLAVNYVKHNYKKGTT